MEEAVVETLINLGRVGMLSFGLLTFYHGFHLFSLNCEPVFEVDELVDYVEHCEGKVLKVHGIAKSLKSFDSFNTDIITGKKIKVVYSANTDVFESFPPEKFSRIKYSNILLTGFKHNLSVYINKDTKVHGQNIISTRKRDTLGWKDSINSLIHLATSIFSTAIAKSLRKFITSTEDIIKEGSDLYVKGLIYKTNNSVKMLPKYVSLNPDIEKMHVRNMLGFSSKLFVISAFLWLAAWAYRKTKAGEWAILSKKEPQAEEGSGADCIICLTYQRNVVFSPCNHLAVCSRCSNLPNCPVCRAVITKISEIKFIL